MLNIKILIVEDDKDKREDYSRFLKAYNIEHNDTHEVEAIYSTNKDEAFQKLNNTKLNFDGAIVDLDLLGNGGTDKSGNDVIIEIKRKLRFPIFVITGTPHHIAEDLDESNSIFEVFERDDVDLDEIFNKFKSIKETGILNLLNRNGKIEELIQNIFWNHLSTSLDNWINDTNRNSSEKEESLLRYTILHMLEYLDENKVHPSEFYITRPVKENVSTGDLIEFDSQRYVVLTPACDFVKRPKKGRNVRLTFLLKINELSLLIPDMDNIESIDELSSKKKQLLGSLVSNKLPFYHFIPKHNHIKPGIIDFQDKYSISIETIEEKIKENTADRFATISMPYIKDIISRYSNYYSRQGSPDFDSNEIYNSLL